MALISDVLRDPYGNPRVGVTVHMRARRTSSRVIVKAPAQAVTDSNGRYSLTVEPGTFDVTITEEGNPPEPVGRITVNPDSIDGPLNDFLTEPREDEVTPEVIAIVNELRSGARIDADRAEVAAMLAQSKADTEFTFTITSTDPDGTIAGLAATNSGQSFRVGQGKGNGFKYYLNDNGVALEISETAGANAIKAIGDRVPIIGRTPFFNGFIGKDGGVSLVFRTSDNKGVLGDGTVLNDALGSLSVFTSIQDGMVKSEKGMGFVVINAQNTPSIYLKNNETSATRLFNIITDGQVITADRSGFWGGSIDRNRGIGITFSVLDNAAMLGDGTYINKRKNSILKRLESVESTTSHLITKVAYAPGDSLAAGTGGTPYAAQLASKIGNYFDARIIAIGGQRPRQTAMILGALPTFLTVSGNRIPASGNSVQVTHINGYAVATTGNRREIETRLLSTPSNNKTYIIDGFINGLSVRLTRTASGSNNDAKSEFYSLTALSGSGVDCPEDTRFVNEMLMQGNANYEIWIEGGINEFRSGVSTPSGYDQDVDEIKLCLDAMVRFSEVQFKNIMISGLFAGDYSVEHIGGARHPRILEINTYLRETYPAYYAVGNTGLDLMQTLLANGNGSTEDNAAITNGICPPSLRSDGRHLNTAGYGVWAQMGYEFRTRKGY